MRRALRHLALWIALLLLFPPAAGAFDRVLHSDVVYAAARANGFTHEEASLIANASQSLDDNLSTSAFSWDLVNREFAQLQSGEKSLDQLPHMISGQIFHALSGGKVRELVEEEHLRRIADARKQNPRLALVYLGEYLHFLADTAVHPDDPFLGHFLQGHDPDLGDRHQNALRTGTFLVSRQLGLYRKGSPLAKTPPSAEVRAPDRLHDDPKKNRFLEDVVKSVEDSWQKTYPEELPYLLKEPGASVMDWPSVKAFQKLALQSMGLGQAPEWVRYLASTYTEVWDEARKARAHAEIARLTDAQGYTSQKERYGYKPIDLDENGHPAGPKAHLLVFGGPGKPEAGSFAKRLAENKVLKDERLLNAGMVSIRAMGGALETVVKTVSPSPQLAPEVLREVRKAAAWRPPSGPGGIALDPGLVMPDGLGKPLRITIDGSKLVLETSKGRYVFKDVDPRSFATIARTVASGEIPSITIGTIPSDRDGYARVLYSPSLIGTWEGAALYESDILFKAVFARLPFGPGYAFNRPKGELYRAFPGTPDGGAVRLWITSRRVVLEERSGTLVPARHGMRILSETFLDGRGQDDPEMEAYAAKLTAHWDRLAEKIWPFRAVEDMARATAVVFWARSEGVPIEPLILTLPPRTGYTPSHAPVIGVLGEKRLDLAGGVALTPEDKGTTSGRLFLSWMRSTILAPGRRETHPALVTSLVVLSVASFALGTLVVCALLLWAVCRLCRYPGVGFMRALRVWALACAADFILAMAVFPLVREGGPLGFFDADMLAFFATVVAFPCLLFALLYRSMGEAGRAPVRRAALARMLLIAVGLLGPVCNAALGEAIALGTAAVGSPVPGPILNTLLTCELAPVSVWSQGFSSVTPERAEGPGVFLLPRSLLLAQRHPFENLKTVSLSPAEKITGAAAQADPGLPMHLPFTTLHRIAWPDDMPRPEGFTQYSPDGSPPFVWQSSGRSADPAQANRFQVFRVLDSPEKNAREVARKEGSLSETLWFDPEPLLEDSDFVRAELLEVGDSSWVKVILSPGGAEKYAEVSTEHVGERLGIFIMGKLVIAPRVMSPIKDGIIQIAGGMNMDEAKRIVDALNRK